MIRTDEDTASSSTDDPNANGAGVPGYRESGTPCTVVGPLALNHIQEEIATLIEHYGETLDSANKSQLVDIIGGVRGPYGDGSDGSATISIATSLTRDTYYQDLTINSGIELNAAGCRIFVRGTLTLNASSVIKNDGDAASGPTAGAGATSQSIGDGATGGQGGESASEAGANGGNIGSAGMGASGGNGGLGSGGGAGGSGGTVTAPVNVAPRDVTSAIQCAAMDWQASGGGVVAFRGGAGGAGGGASSGGSDGGGGGGGGGVLMVAACIISTPTSGTAPEIRANGGQGGNGAGGAGGGGGGGGGGCAIVVRRVVLGSGFTHEASGGGGGTGNIAGGAGGTGTTIELIA